MKLGRHLSFTLRTAWQGFWRNAAVSLAAVVSITLILVLAGVNLLLGHAFGSILDTYRSRVSVISISIADDTPLTTVDDFEAQLRADPRVASVRLVTKDEALAHFAGDPSNQSVVKQL